MHTGRKRNSRNETHKEGNKNRHRSQEQILRNANKINIDANLSGASINLDNLDPWTPGSYVALKALLSARLCSAIWGLINDCDETYNYWEPTHYLLYGKGFQTWEYSPTHALRSYTYLLLHAVPAFIYKTILQSNKMLVFFFIRCFLALIACGCELYFYRGVCKEFGANVGRITLAISVFSAGMFISSTAYLPSSFAMYMTMLSFGAWFHRSLELAVFTTAVSAFLGWPFSALVGIPIAYDMLIRSRKAASFLKWSFISSFTILMPMIQIDSTYFGHLVIAPLNIVIYNVFTSHGPNLYGTSPPSFYFINGFLNFNFIFLAALISLPLYLVLTSFNLVPTRKTSSFPVWLSLMSFYIWIFVFVFQPHKEERFIFPVYPLVCLSAAFAIDTFQKFIFSLFIKDKKKHYLQYTNWFSLSLITVTSILSISRIVGQYQGYRAPFDTYLELNRLELEGSVPNLRSITVCYGREWHRFPSSFFLPGLNWNVRFIESDFRGQLPQPYSEASNGTAITPLKMNDINKEEKSRYVSPSSCHFLIDIDKEEETEREPRYSTKSSQWNVLHSVPFLDASRSPQFLRAFYVPFLTEKYCSYVNYVLLQSVKLSIKTNSNG